MLYLNFGDGRELRINGVGREFSFYSWGGGSIIAEGLNQAFKDGFGCLKVICGGFNSVEGGCCGLGITFSTFSGD